MVHALNPTKPKPLSPYSRNYRSIGCYLNPSLGLLGGSWYSSADDNCTDKWVTSTVLMVHKHHEPPRTLAPQ